MFHWKAHIFFLFPIPSHEWARPVAFSLYPKQLRNGLSESSVCLLICYKCMSSFLPKELCCSQHTNQTNLPATTFSLSFKFLHTHHIGFLSLSHTDHVYVPPLFLSYVYTNLPPVFYSNPSSWHHEIYMVTRLQNLSLLCDLTFQMVRCKMLSIVPTQTSLQLFLGSFTCL